MADDNEHQREITVNEARRIVALNECSTRGHDFTVLSVLGSGDPRRVVCGRCGRSWGIAAKVIKSATLAEVSVIDGKAELGLADVEYEEPGRG